MTGNGANYEVQYYLRDHLGNVRMVMNEAGTIVQETEYFPFGLAIPRPGTDAVNKYQFQGQEKQPETGYSQFKWRMHDPTIGRFISVDPLSDKYYHNSVYAFSENKVTAHVELEGLEAVSFVDYLRKANSGPRYEMSQPIDPAIGTKLGVSGTVSLGAQAGAVDKQLGMGIGVYVNLGSVDVATLQLDIADGSKGELMGENKRMTITQGGELLLGVVGFETTKERELL